MSKKLIVFSVGGTLLHAKMGGFKDILVILGKSEEVEKIDEEYQKRKYVGPQGMEQVAELYQGFSEQRLREIAGKYYQDNLIEGAKECLLELKDKGYIIGALSSNPQFIMDSLIENLPLDFSEGTRLEFKEGIATGKLQKKVDRYGKVKILEEKIQNYGLEKENVIIVGGSITDLPMAESAGTFIAFQSEEEMVKEKATKIIESFQQLKDELA